MQRWLTGLLLAIFLIPSLFIVYQAIVPLQFEPLGHLSNTVLPGYIGNTVLLTLLTLMIAVVIGVGSAFLMAFFAFPGQRLLDTALVLPLVLPPYLVAIVYREMSHIHVWSPNVESLHGAAGILAVSLYPYIYLLARTAFQHQAMGYIEIGQSLGLNRMRIATRALLPLAFPAIMLGIVLVTIEVISDYGTVSILGIRTLTTAVHRIWFEMYDPTLAAQVALIVTVLPLLMIAVYGFLSRGKSFVNPTNRPGSPRRSQLTGSLNWLAALFCTLPVLLGFIWPLAVLLNWAIEAFGQFDLQSLYHDLLQTLGLALATTLLTVILGLWLALTGRWAHNRGRTLGTLWLISLNYAMPAIVLAVALLFLTAWTYETTLGEWLSNSAFVVLLAMVLRFTAFAYFSLESGLQGISQRIDETISCAGKTRFHAAVKVLLPMLRGSLVVGGLLVFVITAKELTLALVLQPFGFKTLSMSIYYFADIDFYEPAAIYALCLMLVVIYPVLSINRWLSTRY